MKDVVIFKALLILLIVLFVDVFLHPKKDGKNRPVWVIFYLMFGYGCVAYVILTEGMLR